VVNHDARVNVGESVVVFGVGGVGLSVVQALGMVSANPVIAVDIVDKKLHMARQSGADYCFNSRLTDDLPGEIRKIVGAAGADVIIDTTGNARVIETAYDLTHPDGRTILVGVPRKDDKVSIYTLPLHFKKVLKGSHGGGTVPQVDIPRYIRLVEAGKLNLDGLITHEYTLDHINEAIDMVRSGESGRVIVCME